VRVLFTSPVLEHPPAGGSQLRVENTIKALAGVCSLDIISRSPPSLSGGQAAEEFYKNYAQEFHVAPTARDLSGNRYVRKIQRVAGDFAQRHTKREADFLLSHVDRRAIDVVWFGYGNISFPLVRRIKELRPNVKVVCDTDSIWSRFILRGLPYTRGPRRAYVRWAGWKKEREEHAWVNLCDVTTAVSEVDAVYYRALAGEPSRVCILSNVIDIAAYQHPPAPPPDFQHPCIYLAGTFGHYHSPMDTAARWVIEEVLPLVQQSVPNIHFYIVGNQSDRMFGHLSGKGMTVTGKLPSVLPYLCNADVALVPLKFESGTRYKILEAGACGVPLVSTTLGAEGIPVGDNEHILIADDPAAFARAIVRLLNDKGFASQLAENCRRLVLASYSIEALQKEAQAILDRLAA
jgi:glycosyltransferase involved in cell wall biosynthesis